MNHWHSQRYREAGFEQNVSSDLLDRAVQTAENARAKNSVVPVLFTLRHIARETNVPYLYLRKIVSRADNFQPYRVFKLQKKVRNGGQPRARVICAPEPDLLRVQRWIHENILTKVQAHAASVAYANGSRISAAAAKHCGAKWLIKLDVRDFFDSILEPSVYKVFRSMGYQPLVAFELTRLCTRLRKTGNLAKRATTPYLAVKSYQNAFLGHLPQGAPTSPILANLVSFSLDVTLTALAEKRGLRYTRYADDLAFSTASISFSRDTAEDVIVECYSELRAHGYWPNRAKTNVVPPGARKVVLGLLVDGATPRLSREFKDRLRMHIYYMQSANVGPVKHAAKRGFDSVVGLQHHVLGMAAFAIGIEADWGKARMRELKAIQWPTAATLMP